MRYHQPTAACLFAIDRCTLPNFNYVKLTSCYESMTSDVM